MITTFILAGLFCALWFGALGGYALCEYHYRLMGRRRNDGCECDVEQTVVAAELRRLFAESALARVTDADVAKLRGGT